MAVHTESEQDRGEVFLDARGNGRAMRLSWHPEADVVVLSLWREETCAGTFRMPHEDVGAFVDALVDSLRDAPGVHLPPPVSAPVSPPTQAMGDDTQAMDATQAMPAQQTRAAFADWAFRSSDVDGRANAS